MAATWVSLPAPEAWADVAMLASARRPVALRAGSAVPRRTLSVAVVAAVSSAQLYFLLGQPSEAAAVGTAPTVTGELATLPHGVSGTPLPLPRARSVQSDESGTQIW